MKTTSSTFNSKWLFSKIILTGLITTVLFSLLFAFKTFLAHYIAPSSFGFRGLMQQKEIDYLFIGSSHTRQSYDAKVIEKICQCNVYVLSYSGLDPFFMEIALKHIKKANIKFKKIFIEAYSIKVFARPWLSDSRLYSHAPIGFKIDLMQNLYHSLHYKKKKIINLAISENNEDFLSFPISNKVLSRFNYKGSYQNKTTSLLTKKEYKNIPYTIEKKIKPEINQLQIESIKRLATFFPQKTIWLETPMPDNAVAHPISMAGYHKFKDLVQQSGQEMISLWKNDDRLKDRSNFSDWNHLSNQGRKFYSNDIAQYLLTL